MKYYAIKIMGDGTWVHTFPTKTLRDRWVQVEPNAQAVVKERATMFMKTKKVIHHGTQS